MVTFTWGILGVAKHARGFTIPAIHAAAGNEVVAIASRDADRAAAAAGELGIARAYGSYEELLADPDIDAVYNPLPNHLHKPLSIAAMEAGKHVLCEKPLGMDRSEATEMAAAMDRTGKRVMEAFMYKHHPQWDKVQEIIGSGAIGDVRMTQSWFSYFQQDPHNIRWDLEMGGGALLDIGCYSISSARLVFGGEPETVDGALKRHPDHGVDVAASGILGFADGHATFTVSVEQHASQGMRVVGTDGHLFVERPFNPWLDRDALITVHHDAETERVIVPQADHFQLEIERFADAIINDTPFVVTMEDTLANLGVIDRVFAAAG